MNVGGQAVVEGAMMRNKERFAVAVRLPNGKVKVLKDKSAFFPKWFDIFFVRGAVGLGYTLYDGVRALIWSSNQQLGKEEKLSKKEIFTTIGLSFLFSILLFIIVPFFFAHFIQSEGFWFNVLDGFFRVILFLSYLLLISIFIFSLITGELLTKLVGRILLLPVIAGIGYELIKLSDKFSRNSLVKILIAPGLWLQRITTKEPNDQQLQVGIQALKGVVE